MTKRPTAITIFALYLLIVFGISIVGSIYGAIEALPPYSTQEWLVLALPKAAAFLAGIAFWKMLRLGAWLWTVSVLTGWALAIGLGTGFFPTFSIALIVTTLILAASVWVIYSNWNKLLPLNSARGIEGAPNA
ncbi:MAG: hypothetical protein C0510_10840 [Erythrobacter sp.]|nr:hypothetical protein [Erythrobacter sp.]